MLALVISGHDVSSAAQMPAVAHVAHGDASTAVIIPSARRSL